MIALIQYNLVLYHLCKSGDQIVTTWIFRPEFVFWTPFSPGNLEYREMSLENGEAGHERINSESESEPPAIVALPLLKSPSLLLSPSPRNQIPSETSFTFISAPFSPGLQRAPNHTQHKRPQGTLWLGTLNILSGLGKTLILIMLIIGTTSPPKLVAEATGLLYK